MVLYYQHIFLEVTMKKFAIIFLAVVLALTLVACGNKGGGVFVETGSLVETPSTDADTTTDEVTNQDNDAEMPDSWLTNDDEK